jgi:hypothetical protein
MKVRKEAFLHRSSTDWRTRALPIMHWGAWLKKKALECLQQQE